MKMDPTRKAELRKFVSNVRAALGQARSGRAGARNIVPVLRTALAQAPAGRRPLPPRNDAKAHADRLQRLAAAEADIRAEAVPGALTMSEHRGRLEARYAAARQRLAALEAELREPVAVTGETGKWSRLYRSSRDHPDGGMPYDLAVRLGRM
jgi:hypothetical protein